MAGYLLHSQSIDLALRCSTSIFSFETSFSESKLQFPKSSRQSLTECFADEKSYTYKALIKVFTKFGSMFLYMFKWFLRVTIKMNGEQTSSIPSAKLTSLVDPPWIPLINIPKGRVHDVIYCYNLGKKCLPPY